MYGKDTRYFKCCFGCPNRHTACYDRCADYLIVKAIKGAADQAERERYIGHRRKTNGRK